MILSVEVIFGFITFIIMRLLAIWCNLLRIVSNLSLLKSALISPVVKVHKLVRTFVHYKAQEM